MNLLVTFFCFFSANTWADWALRYHEDFENISSIHIKKWQQEAYLYQDKYSEKGSYFVDQSLSLPKGFRVSSSFGQIGIMNKGWLTAESYTRDTSVKPGSLVSIQPDPSGLNNKVLKVHSINHTDGSLIRSSEPLQGRYRVSLKIGFADFGTGSDLNGYDGDERAGPWLEQSAVKENGFYWFAISDTLPKPHNNIWWHHHRKVVIDSDNHYPAWTQVWNGTEFIESGEQPIMIFALDGNGKTSDVNGKPFISYSNKQWWPSGEIKAVDAYKKNHWYTLVFERNKNIITIQLEGDFVYGGETSYTTELDLNKNCVWHFNRPFDQKNTSCIKDVSSDNLVWSDYFFFGDPHINFYEGYVFYDDVQLEVWRGE